MDAESAFDQLYDRLVVRGLSHSKSKKKKVRVKSRNAHKLLDSDQVVEICSPEDKVHDLLTNTPIEEIKESQTQFMDQRIHTKEQEWQYALATQWRRNFRSIYRTNPFSHHEIAIAIGITSTNSHEYKSVLRKRLQIRRPMACNHSPPIMIRSLGRSIRLESIVARLFHSHDTFDVETRNSHDSVVSPVSALHDICFFSPPSNQSNIHYLKQRNLIPQVPVGLL